MHLTVAPGREDHIGVLYIVRKYAYRVDKSAPRAERDPALQLGPPPPAGPEVLWVLISSMVRPQRLQVVALHLSEARPAAAATRAPVLDSEEDGVPEGWSLNSPRGSAEQGFGIGWADRTPHPQPPVFDPVAQLADACAFYDAHKFVVVQALSPAEVRELNSVAELFLKDTGDAALQSASGGQGQLFYPLLGSADDIDRYSAVDKYITHPRVLPVVAEVLGGIENVRFGELNWRGEDSISC